MTTPRPQYAVVTIKRGAHTDTIGGQKPITGDPDTVKADLEKAMRGKCGSDFVSVTIQDTPYQPSK